MPDPQSPEILAWLETLPLPERLTALHAMSIAFPQLQRNREWKARIGRVRDELRPTSRELGHILKDAARRAERLKAELAG
jgi:hypothetical protein